MSDEDILECVRLSNKFQRGFRFESTTRFLVMQIAADSPYRNPEGIAEIRAALSSLSVIPRHYQIDDEWFLYIYLSEPANSIELSTLLAQWASSRGLNVAPGVLEIHPSEQPLPFPLQKHFTWVNDRCQLLVRREELSFDDAIGFFLEDAVKHLNDPHILSCSIKHLSPALAQPVETKPQLAVVDFAAPEADSEIVQSSSADSSEANDAVSEFTELIYEVEEGTNLENQITSVAEMPELENADSVADLPTLRIVARAESEDLGSSVELDELNSGAKLIIFHDEHDVDESRPTELVTQIEDHEGAQLLLFPVRLPVEESLEAIETPTPPRGPRKRRNLSISKGTDES